MDAELINAFIEATLYTLETTASVQFSALEPFLKNERAARGDISGVIELSGDFTGTVSVSFARQTILDIVSRMFGEKMTELNDDIKDAVGEILNMIAGRLNTQLADSGRSLKAKFSEVLTGDRHVVPHLANRPVIAIPLNTDSGIITLEVCFES